MAMAKCQLYMSSLHSSVEFQFQTQYIFTLKTGDEKLKSNKMERGGLEAIAEETARKKKNKRRFGEEQIRLLESIFESETSKLEPRRKLQLARELGLQPRQIDIWFQNRRARWKSKQIEQDYKRLKADYDILASKYESLKKEHQSLILQVLFFFFFYHNVHNCETHKINLCFHFSDGEAE